MWSSRTNLKTLNGRDEPPPALRSQEFKTRFQGTISDHDNPWNITFKGGDDKGKDDYALTIVLTFKFVSFAVLNQPHFQDHTMAPSNSGPPIPPESARNIYDDVWAAGPFTHFHMVRYLMEKYKTHVLGDRDNQLPEGEDICDKIMRDFLHNPGILNNTTIIQEMNKDELFDANGLSPVFTNNTGTCTAFAVRVVHLLNIAHPDFFNFIYYDMIGHRLARCKKTKMVIDSSEWHLGTLQNDGKTMKFREYTLVWEVETVKVQEKTMVRKNAV